VAIRYSDNQIDEINKLIKDSDLNQSQIAEAVNKKFPNATNKVKGDTVTHYARKYFKVPQGGALNNAYKKRFSGVLTTKEGTEKLLKLLKNKKDLKAAITKDFNDGMVLEDIRLKYRPGGAGANLMPAQVPKMGKDLLKRLLGEYNLDFEARKSDLRKVDVTSDDAKDLAKRIRTLYADKTLSREAANKQLGLTRQEVKVFETRWNEKNPNNPLIKTKRINEPFKGAGQQTQKYKDKTKQLQKFQTFLKKYQNNPPKSGTTELAKAIKASGLSLIGFQQDIERLKRIYKGESRPGFVIDKTLKNNISKFPISTALTRDILLQAGYTSQQIKKIDKAQNIIRFLERDKGVFLNQLEHKIPKSLVTALRDNKKISAQQYKQLIGKITPVTSSLNQWKKYFDVQRLSNLQEFLSSPMENSDVLKFNKAENEIIKTIKNVSGGYDAGKIKVDANGNIDIKSPDEVFTAKTQGVGTQNRAILDYYKNIKYHNNIVKAYKADKNNPIFGTLKAYDNNQNVKLLDEKISNELSKAKTPEQLIKYLTQNTDSSLFKGLLKTANPELKAKIVRALKIGGGGGALGLLIPTLLAASEPGEMMEENQDVLIGTGVAAAVAGGVGLKYNKEIGAFVTGNDDDIAAQADLKKYAADNPMEVKVGEEPVKAATNKSVLSNVGKAMARVGAPLPTALIDSYFIGQQVKEGKGTAEIASNPLNWLGLATMEPLSKAAGIAEGGGLNKALRLGLNPATIRGITRFAGLPGLAVSTAMTAYDQYQKYKDGEGFIFNLLNQKGTE
jgi:hypothetical protein